MSADADAATRSRAARLVVWLAIIVAVDQLTKIVVVARYSVTPLRIIGDTVTIQVTRNSGAAFSRFQGFTPVLALGAIVIAVVLYRTLRTTTDHWMVVGLVMVLGGALGNLADRLFRAPGVLRGEVVDFVKVGSFPLFNVADSCITIGAIVIAISSIRIERRAAARVAGTETDTAP